MPNILAIVPFDFAIGFKLTGVDTQGCESEHQARLCLEEEALKQRYDIIFIDENFLLSSDERFNKKIQAIMRPLIMAIPLKRNFKEEAVEIKDYFSKMIQDAIGYEIRIK